MKENQKLLNEKIIKGNHIQLLESKALITIHCYNKKKILLFTFHFNKGLQKYAFDTYDKLAEDLKKN